MIYTILSIICLVIMAILLAVFIYLFVSKDRSEKIEFIRSFKKGKFAIIYLVAFPLFLMCSLFEGKDIAESIFSSIQKSVFLVALKYEAPTALMQANVTYKVAVIVCFTFVAFNAMMIIISFLHQGIWAYYKYFTFNHGKKNRCIIIGDNQNNENIYITSHDKKLFAGRYNKDEKEKLYIKNIAYKALFNKARAKEWVKKEVNALFKKLKNTNGKANIIINYQKEDTNLEWCAFFVNYLKEIDQDNTLHLDVYVFGNRDYEDLYYQYENNSRGCIHYINIYQQMAIDFVDKYPLTEFMNENQIDYDNFIIKNNINLNVVFIGLGRTNQQLFLTMVANNQFLTSIDNKIVNLPVKYSYFEKTGTVQNKNLNHRFFRYQNEFYDADKELTVSKDDYLPLPDLPGELIEHCHDLNDTAFYNDIYKVLAESELDKKNGKSNYNYVIVSIGNDYSGIDMANKISAKLKQWKLNNTHVFVSITKKDIFKNSSIFIDDNICHAFGNYADVVYDYNHIIQEKFSEMSILRNFIYDIEKDMKHVNISENERKESRIKWFVKRNPIERESNVYACLNIRNKLHMMGLDYVNKSEEGNPLSENEYLEKYAHNDMPNIVNRDGGIVVQYDIDFKHSPRENLAKQEHYRWNAYMISKGFVPSSIEQILSEKKDDKFTNGKNYDERHHGNLTDFDGLKVYRKLIANRDNINEKDVDVIKYDYQILDGLWWLLDKSGYKIIEI